LRSKYQSPHYPIVLCHGFSGFDKLDIIPYFNPFESLTQSSPKKVKKAVKKGLLQIDYWYGIQEALENLGCTILVAKVSAFGTIEERSHQLHDFINQQCRDLISSSKKKVYNNENTHHSNKSLSDHFENELIKVNLVSHSMGGLDSRFLIHQLANNQLKNPYYKVASLTTIATPHHGSECADFIVDIAKGNPILEFLCPKSIFELTTESLKKFNEVVPQDPEVQYYSYGARFDPRWFNMFNITWRIMKHEIKSRNKRFEATDKFKKLLYDNDGIVSVESAKWGNYVGTLDQVDHLDLINWTNKTKRVVDKLLFNEDSKFNAIALYLDIANNLAKEGV
jgi:triacylglycerol lipase